MLLILIFSVSNILISHIHFGTPGGTPHGSFSFAFLCFFVVFCYFWNLTNLTPLTFFGVVLAGECVFPYECRLKDACEKKTHPQRS